MLNPFKVVNWNPGHTERRTFAKSLIIGFPCLALGLLLTGYLFDKGWNVSLALKLGGIGAAAGLLFLLAPMIVRPFYVGWYCVACCIGLVVGNVLLAVVYYVLFAGTGLIMRACGRRRVRNAVDQRAATYWRDAGPPPEPRRYFRQS